MIPTDIPALCSAEQGALLQKYAVNKTVLELGSYMGFSTICMARTATIVYSVDTHRGDEHLGRHDTFQYFLGHLQRYKVIDKVALLVGYTYDILPRLTPGMFDMAFVDATHSYEAVSRDIEMTIPLLKPGGLIAFHDYQEKAPHTVGVTQAVDENIAAGNFKIIDREDTLVICQLSQ